MNDYGNANVVDWDALLKEKMVDPDLPERIRNTNAVQDWELDDDFVFDVAKLIGRNRRLQKGNQIVRLLGGMQARPADLEKVRDSAASLRRALLGDERTDARSCITLSGFLNHLNDQAAEGWNGFTRMLHMADELAEKLEGRPADPLPAYNDAGFEAHRLCQELQWIADAADLAVQEWDDEKADKGGRSSGSGLQGLAIHLFTRMQRGVEPGEGLGKPQEAFDALRELLDAAGIECNLSDASLRSYLKQARQHLRG